MRAAGRLFVVLLAAIGFLYLVVTLTPLDTWWAMRLAGPWKEPPGEVLIVPGADSLGDAIGLSSYWRSVYAVRVWRQGGFQAIVVCGGRQGGQISLAELMRDFIASQGVPRAVIYVETESRSTRENGLKAKPLVDRLPGRKVLLTSDYHMFRAWRVFRKVGIDVQPRPFPDASKQATNWMNRWTAFVNLSIETTKIAYYWLRGWI